MSVGLISVVHTKIGIKEPKKTKVVVGGRAYKCPLSPPHPAAAPKAALPDKGVSRGPTPAASAARVGCAAAVIA